MNFQIINGATIENLSNGKFLSMSGIERGQFFVQKVKPFFASGWRKTIRPHYEKLNGWWKWRTDVNRRLDNLMRGVVYPEPDELALYCLHLLETSEAFRVVHQSALLNFMDIVEASLA